MSGGNIHWYDIRAPAALGDIGNGYTTDWAGFQFQANSTDAVLNELRFATSKTIRRSGIILASFNAVAGMLLAGGIFWDCYRAAKRADPKMDIRSSMYKIIGPMNIFPFVLAIGIMVQGIIIAVEQSKGLKGILILGCEPISQIMLPTLFLVPLIQFVFGMETVARALRRRAFASFGKWTVTVCVVLIVSSLAALYAVTRVDRPPNFCFASLVWFVQKWRVLAFSLFTAICGSLLLGSMVTFVRLFRDSAGGAIERIAASRMVYYMCIGAITNSVVIPFFASLMLHNDMKVTRLRGNLSMAAMVAINLTALTNGGLYVFLRACHSSNIGRKGYFEVDREKQQQLHQQEQKPTRRGVVKSPVTETYTNQMEQPVSPPPRVFNPEAPDQSRRPSAVSASQIGVARTLDAKGPSSIAPPRNYIHARKASYSVFPQLSEAPQQPVPTLDAKPLSLLPAATYSPPSIASTTSTREVNDADIDEIEISLMSRDIESLLPPPPGVLPAFAPGRHHRGSSIQSSATVQIGLRLSNADDMRGGSAVTAARPFMQQRAPTPRPASSIYPQSILGADAPPEDDEPFPDELRGPVRVGSKLWVDPDKQLPPPPLRTPMLRMSTASRGWRRESKGKERERESLVLLSPTVYSPDGESGVGTASGAGTGTMTSPSDRDARMSPFGGPGSATEKKPSEWI